ncbi:hypothetical protein SAMN05421640_2217 [Ekhidna lutea]|uniref:PH domain-containing protein n=1 Tax=Ekhidna lutea TaxID=447679 RepID=A0A239JLL6_EKHLU|nr:hypothetical protein [Ekhidna lutea]SNT06203.1 hypothetical protein SAMN05421640_2217 [Ekhidna lutea]
MKKLISSELTLTFKIFFPTVFGGPLIYLTIIFVDFQYYELVIVTSSLLGTVIIIFYSALLRLKSVSMDDQNFYISNHFRHIIVPITDLDKVTHSWLWNIQPVTMHFNKKTEFGTSIKFMPEIDLTPIWKAPPIVKKLKSLISQNSFQDQQN